MADPIQPKLLGSHEAFFGGTFVPLGCLDVQMAQGRVHFHDAAGMTTGFADRPEAPRSITLLLYNAPDPGDRNGFGLIHQLTAEGARNMAASLARLADQLDGGRGKQ